MSKSLMLVLGALVLIALLCGVLGPAWPFEVMLGLGGGLFGVVLGLLGAVLGLLLAVAVALLAGPVVLFVVAFALLAGGLAIVFSLGLVAVPVLLPVALLIGFIWLLARRGPTHGPRALPAPIAHA